jgi:hypothetical protein
VSVGGRPIGDEEFLFLRLFRVLDDVQQAIARLERVPDGSNEQAIAALERLRVDMVVALRLAGRPRILTP